ncbi:hypothetical protein PHYPSEUDO_003339 [Phytophthora pseudosyringae]|uniref:RING-type domain-containing protein n=1 Tax=Phytophthora pseudosyringae TaxID=221518 RepID=A0A8T1VVZ6_9STRA|nr:hypothetical protein PHYPSEUDO_003339 [Phytophthora pseudosyringae]
MESGGVLNYADFYDSIPRRTPGASKRHLRWFSVDNLRFHEQKELPLLVNVSSTSMEEDFVVYHCTVSSVTSKKTWSMSYRYSEFLEFRAKLDDQWTCHDVNCSGSCQALRDVVSAYFPKKRLAVLSTNHGAIASRKKKFEFVLIHLLRTVLLPGSVMKCRHARQNLPANVFEFLGVEDAGDRRSLLQIFADNCSTASENSADDTTQCMVCLDNVGLQQHDAGGSDTDDDDSDVDGSQITPNRSDEDNAQTVLPCAHTFHRKCIFEWLLFAFHCPVCRAGLCPNAFTSNLRPKTHIQWWLSDFEEDLLVPSTAQ